jgi:hypothetical protein
MFHQCLARDVNLRGILFMTRLSSASSPLLLLSLEFSSSVLLASSPSVEDSRGAVLFPRFSSSIN